MQHTADCNNRDARRPQVDNEDDAPLSFSEFVSRNSLGKYSLQDAGVSLGMRHGC